MDGRPVERQSFCVMPLPVGPETRLRDHPDGYVTITCRRCGHARELRAGALAPLIGWNARLAQAAERFRCSQCHARAAEVTLGFDRPPRGWTKNPS